MGPLWGQSSGLAGAEETVREGSVPGTGAGCWDEHRGGLLAPRVPVQAAVAVPWVPGWVPGAAGRALLRASELLGGTLQALLWLLGAARQRGQLAWQNLHPGD